MSTAEPVSDEQGIASYQQIKDIVGDCVERMKRSGESHPMLAKWISEGINAAIYTPPINGVNKAYERSAEVAKKLLSVSDDYAFNEADGIFHTIMGLKESHSSLVSSAPHVDEAMVERAMAAVEMPIRGKNGMRKALRAALKERQP